MSTIENDVTARISHALRAKRQQRGLSLRALAESSGVSASMISDVERGAKSPTVATLAALAGALAVPLSALVDPSPDGTRLRVVRAAERVRLRDPASGMRSEDLGPAVAGSRVRFLRVAVPPRARAGPFDAHAPGTIEHVLVASGAIALTLGTERATLATGDSCSCRADAPHAFDNSDGAEEAVLYVVSEPP